MSDNDIFFNVISSLEASSCITLPTCTLLWLYVRRTLGIKFSLWYAWLMNALEILVRTPPWGFEPWLSISCYFSITVIVLMGNHDTHLSLYQVSRSVKWVVSFYCWYVDCICHHLYFGVIFNSTFRLVFLWMLSYYNSLSCLDEKHMLGSVLSGAKNRPDWARRPGRSFVTNHTATRAKNQRRF